MASATSFSFSQKLLHWVMAIFIFYNLLFADAMEHTVHAIERGNQPDSGDLFWANVHAYLGIAVAVLAAIRLAMRFAHGVPAEPAEEPAWAQLGAKIAHAALYIAFFLMPALGVAKYYFGSETMGDLHSGPVKVILWALIGVHVAGVIVHQFVWRTNLLRRMTTA